MVKRLQGDALFKQLFYEHPDAHIILSSQFEILNLNPAAKKVLLDLDDITNDTVESYLIKKCKNLVQLGKTQENIDKILAPGSSSENEYYLRLEIKPFTGGYIVRLHNFDELEKDYQMGVKFLSRSFLHHFNNLNTILRFRLGRIVKISASEKNGRVLEQATKMENTIQRVENFLENLKQIEEGQELQLEQYSEDLLMIDINTEDKQIS